jgi:hypothetical protein
VLVQAAGSRLHAEAGLLTEVEYSGTWTHTYKGSPSGSAQNPGTETVTSKLTFTESASLFTPATALAQAAHGANSYDSPVKVTLSGQTSITYTGSNLTGCSASFFARGGLKGDQWLVGGFGLPLAEISVNEQGTKGLVAVYAEAPGLRSSVHQEFIVRRTGGDPSDNACDSANMPIGEFPCNNISLINDPEYTPGDRGFNRPPYGFLHAVAKLDPHTPTYSHEYHVRKVLKSCDGADTVTADSRLIVNNRHATGPLPTGKPEPTDPKLVKLEAKLAAQNDLRNALQAAPLPCAEAALGAGITLSGAASLSMPLGTLGAMTAAVAGGICGGQAIRIKNDLAVIQRKDPPLGRFGRLDLPGCGDLSGTALAACTRVRAAAAALLAATQRTATAANALDVAFVALGTAVRQHKQTAVSKDVVPVRTATANLRSSAAAASVARAAFYRQIGQAGANLRLTRKQAAAGIAALLKRLKALGVDETVLRKNAGALLVPKAAVFAVAAAVRPSAPPSGKPTITSVTFTGSAANPTTVVHGTNLGKLPAPSPAAHPSGQNGCPTIAGDNGFDYGTSLYIAVPSQNWSGGRYRPSLNETDCLDLVVTKFTSTEVHFHFGPFYTKFYPQFSLAAGLQVTVVVNGARFNTTVTYD